MHNQLEEQKTQLESKALMLYHGVVHEDTLPLAQLRVQFTD